MDGTTFDALMPRQIAARAEDVGVAKAGLDAATTVMLAVLAGAFISLGAVFSTVVSTGAVGVLPFGIARALAGLSFSLGLILVVVAGAELFTGNNLLVIAFASRKVTAAGVLRNWVLVYAGNFIGCGLTAGGMFLAGLHGQGGGAVGKTALALAEAKCSLGWGEAFMRGVFCNALVCLAVWLCMSCRSTGEKVLAIIFPITAFVAAGLEHSVANMYFVPTGVLIRELASGSFWSQAGLSAADYPHVEFGRFVWANLIPVTLGNVAGGGVLVGAVYWAVYCRKSRV